MSTLTAWLQALAAERGEAEALIEPGGETVSFAGLEDRVGLLAAGLRAHGLGAGDRIASYLPNGILPVELLLAASRVGAVTVGLNTRYRSDDLHHVLARLRPRFLVAARSFLGIDFPSIVAGAVDGLAHPPSVLWPADIEALRRAARPLVDDAARAEDLAVAFTTSGTTGRPKLAAHNHVATVLHLLAAARSLEVEPTSTGLVGLPLCGTFGFVSALSLLAGGGRVVISGRFEAGETAALMEHHRVSQFNGSDDMVLAVLAQHRDLQAWRHGVVADFTGKAEQAVERAETVGARLTGVYGSSETFALLARWSPGTSIAVRARSGGVPVDPSTEARAVDPESGALLGARVPGELQLRGPSVLNAYLEEDRAVTPSLVDGWLATGDLGVIDGGGGFVYQGRLNDSLRLRGFLTDPAEIEQHLLDCPRVTGAQVVGAPKPGGGEVAVAFVVGDEVDEAALLEHCRGGLANYKVPARIIAVDAFPTIDGANGVKIRKSELRTRAAELMS